MQTIFPPDPARRLWWLGQQWIMSTDQLAEALHEAGTAMDAFGRALEEMELHFLRQLTPRQLWLFYTLLDCGWFRYEALDAALHAFPDLLHLT